MHVSYMCLSEAQSELITFVKKSRNPEILPKFPNFFLYSQKFPKKGQFQAISPTYPIIPRIGIWKSQIGNPGGHTFLLHHNNFGALQSVTTPRGHHIYSFGLQIVPGGTKFLYNSPTSRQPFQLLLDEQGRVQSKLYSVNSGARNDGPVEDGRGERVAQLQGTQRVQIPRRPRQFGSKTGLNNARIHCQVRRKWPLGSHRNWAQRPRTPAARLLLQSILGFTRRLQRLARFSQHFQPSMRDRLLCPAFGVLPSVATFVCGLCSVVTDPWWVKRTGGILLCFYCSVYSVGRPAVCVMRTIEVYMMGKIVFQKKSESFRTSVNVLLSKMWNLENRTWTIASHFRPWWTDVDLLALLTNNIQNAALTRLRLSAIKKILFVAKLRPSFLKVDDRVQLK